MKKYAYYLPTLAILAVFVYLPVVLLFYFSFLKRSADGSQYFTFANYLQVVSSGEFWQSIGNTVWMTVTVVVLTISISYIVSGIIMRMRWDRYLKPILIFPYVTSTAGSAVIWSWLFMPQFGFIYWIFGKIGITPVNWITNSQGIFRLIIPAKLYLPGFLHGPSLALVFVIIFTVWHSLGFNILLLIAALSRIPKEVKEAAAVDGAGGFSILSRIELPMIWPTISLLAMLGVIGTIKSFNQIYVLTGGGPLGSSTTLPILIFREFYENANLGIAAAASMVMIMMILAVTLVQKRFYDKLW